MGKKKAKMRNAKRSPIVVNTWTSLLEAAESGDLRTQHYIGACYATGDWDGPKDEAEAIRWYTRAAESGHAESQYDLGFMLIIGEGGVRDLEKGLWWMEQAAKDGEACAIKLLADIYQKGLFGIEVDADKAKNWEVKLSKMKDGT
jgi:TPR repeat protein